MSSPIALNHKDAPKKALVGLHRTLSHGHRVGVLAQRIAMQIETLVPHGPTKCLDIGCGDMTIAEAIHDHSFAHGLAVHRCASAAGWAQ